MQTQDTRFSRKRARKTVKIYDMEQIEDSTVYDIRWLW